MDKKEKQRIAKQKYLKTEKGKATNNAYNKKWYEANKQKKLEYNKQYRKENPEKDKISHRKWAVKNHKKCRINTWKHRKIITDDWDNVYDIYMDTTNCNYCNKQFKNKLDRNLDHDHTINDSNNIRGIICRECNTTDVLKGYPAIY